MMRVCIWNFCPCMIASLASMSQVARMSSHLDTWDLRASLGLDRSGKRLLRAGLKLSVDETKPREYRLAGQYCC